MVRNGPSEIVVDLTDRIGSTGTEQKASDPNKSGVVFKINFTLMAQLNAKTGFRREVRPMHPHMRPLRISHDLTCSRFARPPSPSSL